MARAQFSKRLWISRGSRKTLWIEWIGFQTYFPKWIIPAHSGAGIPGGIVWIPCMSRGERGAILEVAIRGSISTRNYLQMLSPLEFSDKKGQMKVAPLLFFGPRSPFDELLHFPTYWKTGFQRGWCRPPAIFSSVKGLAPASSSKRNLFGQPSLIADK